MVLVTMLPLLLVLLLVFGVVLVKNVAMPTISSSGEEWLGHPHPSGESRTTLATASTTPGRNTTGTRLLCSLCSGNSGKQQLLERQTKNLELLPLQLLALLPLITAATGFPKRAGSDTHRPYWSMSSSLSQNGI